MPYLVTGQLLGLDIGTNLEVTNCFPFPSRGEREEQEDPDSESVVEYQWEMMKCLREVNVDNNTVGWYQSAYLGSFLNEALIETQFSYQTTIPKCVALIYDPIRTKQGSLSLKAFRLTEAFMELFKNQIFTQEAYVHLAHATTPRLTTSLLQSPQDRTFLQRHRRGDPCRYPQLSLRQRFPSRARGFEAHQRPRL